MEKNKKINKNAFTLVELIVVMSILAILSTLGLISYLGYNKDSRDSARKTDLKNIETSLELFKVKNGTFPTPSNGTGVTFSGAILWTQGTLGTSVIQIIGNLVAVPLDPRTDNEYSYSLLNTNKAYEIGVMLEQNNTSFSPLNNSYAADSFNSLVSGNYNGKIAKVATGTTLHLLAVPSILTTDLSLTTYESIVSANKLVYSGKNNLPDGYSSSGFELNGETGIMVNSSDYILINKGNNDTKNSFSDSDLIQIGQKAKASYSGTIISNEAKIKTITSVDTSDNTSAKELGESLVNAVFK